MRYKKILAAMLGAFILAAQFVHAEQEKRTYLHRSRGESLRAVDTLVKQMPDGSAKYAINDFIGGGDDDAYELVIGKDGRPIKYTNIGGGYEIAFVFTNNSVMYTRKKPAQEPVTRTLPLDQGLLPDFNSRPDPYLTEHILLKAYDFGKGSKQSFSVFDIDNTGDGIATYEISLELMPDGEVVLPNGRFRARHLIKMQQSSAATWYKKRRGSQTDIWVDDHGTILRIYRHREPYELILQNYINIQSRISASESAQGYPQPAVLAP
jgi:hypothetical protein